MLKSPDRYGGAGAEAGQSASLEARGGVDVQERLDGQHPGRVACGSRIAKSRAASRAPCLTRSDRLLCGFGSLLLSPGRIRKLATAVRPSTLLAFHAAFIAALRRRNLDQVQAAIDFLRRKIWRVDVMSMQPRRRRRERQEDQNDPRNGSELHTNC